MRNNAWVKLLYVNQSDLYPDNYVDSSFLASMQKNIHVRTWDYWTLLISSGSVTQHIDSIIMFIVLFAFLYMNYITTFHIFVILFIIGLLGLLSWLYFHENIKFQLENLQYLPSMHDESRSWVYLKPLLLFILYLWGLSPVLKTLTRDISSDTIWTWTLISFSVNALFHDYSNIITLRHERFKDTVSLNASVLGSVVLASRLNFVPCVFAFISLSLIWFALYPIWRRMIHQASRKIFIFWTIVSSSTCVILLSILSLSLGIMYLFLFTVTTTFISPAYLLYLQKYKNEIHGPWDEAKLLGNVNQL